MTWEIARHPEEPTNGAERAEAFRRWLAFHPEGVRAFDLFLKSEAEKNAGGEENKQLGAAPWLQPENPGTAGTAERSASAKGEMWSDESGIDPPLPDIPIEDARRLGLAPPLQIPRDARGRYLKGYSGNPRGARMKDVRVIGTLQMNRDFAKEMEALVWVEEDGKRVRVPYIVALTRSQKEIALTNPRVAEQLLKAFATIAAENQSKYEKLFKSIASYERILLNDYDPRTAGLLNSQRRLVQSL